VILVLILGLIAGTALLASLVFVTLIISIHVTDRRLSLRHPSYGRADSFTRRVLGVHTYRPANPTRCESETMQYDQARR